jgi:hypothetical protein
MENPRIYTDATFGRNADLNEGATDYTDYADEFRPQCGNDGISQMRPSVRMPATMGEPQNLSARAGLHIFFAAGNVFATRPRPAMQHRRNRRNRRLKTRIVAVKKGPQNLSHHIRIAQVFLPQAMCLQLDRAPQCNIGVIGEICG